MKKVFSNFIYQAIFQVMKIIIPIITIPIISRALGPEGVGIYNYTYSITSYFILFAGLGITLYGSREIALVQQDREKLSETFWEIFKLKAILSLVNLFAFIILSSQLDYSLYLYLQVLSVLSVFFDVTWFYIGVEDFKKTMLSNSLIQCIAFILIITLIKEPSDLWKYVLIQSLSFFLPQIFPWFFLRQYIDIKRVKLINSIKRIKDAVNFFIPQIAIIIYTTLNKTFLGIFVGAEAVGYYSSSLTMNLVFITLITTFDTVMLPRMSNMYTKNKDNMLGTLKKTTDGQLFFSIAIMFGMLTIFNKFVPWFLGEKFLFVNNLIPLFSVLIVIVPLGMAISRQYLIPTGNIKAYNVSVLIGAIISVVINIILLPRIGIYGVVIASISAELFVLISRLVFLYKNTTFRFDYLKILKYLSSALVMCLLTRKITEHLPETITTNILQAIIGIIIYMIMTTLLGCNLFVNLYRLHKVKNKVLTQKS